MNENEMDLMSELDELEDMFGQDDQIAQMENVMLSQNLEGFASCFPDWDLHPPVGR